MFRALLGSAAVFVIPVFTMVASSAMAAPPPISHNCTNAVTSAKLQDKIDKAIEGDVIEVSGNCVGFDYVLAKDRLTFRGDGIATITGTGAAPAITITHDQATVEGWALIDGGINHGIVVRASGSALVRDISIIAGEDGIQVIESAAVEVSNVSINANNAGIFAISNGSAVISDTDISGNPNDGVVAAGGGSVRFAGGNTIENNGDFGVIVAAGQARFDGTNTVQGNRVDLDCRQFARVFITQSITSSSRNLSSRDCAVSENGGPVFENHPQNLVDCTPAGTVNDDSITKVLANGVMDITVRGLCDERFDIKTSNVTIRGESPGDGIAYTADSQTAVTIRGAQEVSLIGMTISGPRRAVNVFAGGAAFINNSNFSSNTVGFASSFVGDNSFANITNTTIEGLLVLRHGDVRLFGSTINSPGLGTVNPLNMAMTLNGGSAYIYGSDFTGHVAVNWLSRANFGTIFLGTNWGLSTISNTAGSQPGTEIQCSAYSAVTASPSGIVEDGSVAPGNKLTTDDIADFAWAGDSEDYCTVLGFPAPVP